MSASRIRRTASRVAFTLVNPHRHRWKPKPQYGCQVGRPTSAPYCSMTSCGPGPERKYRSSVPPRSRYWRMETGDEGGVRRKVSEPAALEAR